MQFSNFKFTDQEVYSILLDQARVRIGLGVPLCMLMLFVAWHMDAPFDDARLPLLMAMTTLYLVYNIGFFVIAKKFLLRPVPVVVATAVLDPLMLSAWLFFTGGAAPLFTGFYIFTILGFGFRLGTQPMWIGQGAAVAGFAALIALSEFWRQHLMLSGSVLILLVAVPLYATILIKKLVAAREVAKQESLAKSTLLAKVSHELRTPLNGIVAAANLLKNGKRDSETLAYSDLILHLSDDLLREIDELLDSAKYHARSIEIKEAPFNLEEIAAHLRLAFSSVAAAKDVGLHTEFDQDIVDEVCGDKQCLMRVLMNIASNAVKFTEKGDVHIRFELIGKSAQTYSIRFSVKDTGIGIPHSEQGRIFEPFYRALDVAHRNVPGTGLGMSIAYDIVAAMGGSLKLESEPGKGSLFYFDLLFFREPGIKAQLGRAIEISSPAVVCGKKILAAEDHPVNQMLLKKILDIDGHEVILADTGQQALERLRLEDFDLIFLDYNLEDIDGLAVMQHYHSMQMNHHAPVYFITADATAITKETLKQNGAADILHKPLTLESLRRAVAASSSVAEAQMTGGQCS